MNTWKKVTVDHKKLMMYLQCSSVFISYSTLFVTRMVFLHFHVSSNPVIALMCSPISGYGLYNVCNT